MLRLEPESDLAVRAAVNDHLAGKPILELEGEAIFETRNNRYRIVDGVLFDARDPSMRGAQLVGWLVEWPGDATMEGSWQQGARAVLVEPRNDRQIIVTSTTRRFALGLELPADGQMDHPPGSALDQRDAQATGAPPPQAGPEAPILRAPLAAPLPSPVASAPASRPPLPKPRSAPPPPRPAAGAAAPSSRPPAPPLPRAPVTRAAPPIHAPPRPIAKPASAAPPRPLPPAKAPSMMPRAGMPIPPPVPAASAHALRQFPVAQPSRPISAPTPSEPFPLTRSAPRPPPRATL